MVAGYYLLSLSMFFYVFANIKLEISTQLRNGTMCVCVCVFPFCRESQSKNLYFLLIVCTNIRMSTFRWIMDNKRSPSLKG